MRESVGSLRVDRGYLETKKEAEREMHGAEDLRRDRR